MPSDQRWTGGIANREWTRGHPASRVIDRDRLAAEVNVYLADCRKHRTIINAAYHPTEAGALKIIHHHSTTEADVIRGLYRAAMETCDA